MNININRSGYTTVKTTSNKKTFIFSGFIALIVGIALLCYSVYYGKIYNEKSKNYIETSAIVVGYNYNSDGLAAIVVEYKVNGNSYQKVSNSYSSMPKRIGARVSIKYNPNAPGDAIWTKDEGSIIFPLIGVLFSLVGGYFMIGGFKEKPHNMIESQECEQINESYNNKDVPPEMNNVNQSNLDSDKNKVE